MGLGNTAKKLQRVVDMAETLYQKIDDLRTQVNEVREHVEATSQRVERIERDLDDQRAILDALAREQGIDVEAAAADAVIAEAEPGKTVADTEDSTTDDATNPDDTATAGQ